MNRNRSRVDRQWKPQKVYKADITILMYLTETVNLREMEDTIIITKWNSPPANYSFSN